MVDVCCGALSIKCSILVAVSLYLETEILAYHQTFLCLHQVYLQYSLEVNCLNVPYSQFYKTPKLYSRFVTSSSCTH